MREIRVRYRLGFFKALNYFSEPNRQTRSWIEHAKNKIWPMLPLNFDCNVIYGSPSVSICSFEQKLWRILALVDWNSPEMIILRNKKKFECKNTYPLVKTRAPHSEFFFSESWMWKRPTSALIYAMQIKRNIRYLIKWDTTLSILVLILHGRPIVMIRQGLLMSLVFFKAR